MDAIDADEIANITRSIGRLAQTNREIWALARRHGFPL
jgi:hypothetical protein